MPLSTRSSDEDSLDSTLFEEQDFPLAVEFGVEESMLRSENIPESDELREPFKGAASGLFVARVGYSAVW